MGYLSHAIPADMSSSPVLSIADSEGAVILSILFIFRINIAAFDVSNLSLRSYIFIADNVVLDSAIQRGRRCNYTHFLQSFSVSSAWTRDPKINHPTW